MSYRLIGKVLVAAALLSAGMMAGRASVAAPRFLHLELNGHRHGMAQVKGPQAGYYYLGIPAGQFVQTASVDGGSPPVGLPKATPNIVCEPQECNPTDGVALPSVSKIVNITITAGSAASSEGVAFRIAGQ